MRGSNVCLIIVDISWTLAKNAFILSLWTLARHQRKRVYPSYPLYQRSPGVCLLAGQEIMVADSVVGDLQVGESARG